MECEMIPSIVEGFRKIINEPEEGEKELELIFTMVSELSKLFPEWLLSELEADWHLLLEFYDELGDRMAIVDGPSHHKIVISNTIDTFREVIIRKIKMSN